MSFDLTPITYRPIGVVRSPFTTTSGMPIQTSAAQGVEGTIEIYPPYVAGLRDLEEFSHLILLTHLHRIEGYALEVTPYLDTQSHGIFATRSPKRPNPIGLSIVRLLAVEGTLLRIAEVDLLDETPLLDLKPYVPAFDCRETDRSGWFASRLDQLPTTHADDRFSC